MQNETDAMNSTDDNAGGERRGPGMPAWRWISALVVALLVVCGTTAAQVAGSLKELRLASASDGATILALAGVREFADRADLAALMLTPVGADSMVMKATVFVGDESMGTYSVRLIHVEHNSFRLRSTGRLKSGDHSMMCSLDVVVQVDELSERSPELGLQQQPLCNGSRHESAVTRVNIGS